MTYSSKNFKITGDGEIKEISLDEFLELDRESQRGENDVTIHGYVDANHWITLYQGTKEMTFHPEVLRNLANFHDLHYKKDEGQKPKFVLQMIALKDKAFLH